MSKRLQFLLITFLFLLSGAAGLMYQIVWFKQLSYFLGNSTYAQAIVLATFMSGLAIGAWWWGRKVDSSSKALRVFALLEIGIALYCFFYAPIFNFLERGFIHIVSSNDLASDSGTVLFLRLAVSIVAIIVPTILMGGTLPALVKYFSERIEQVGKNVAIFYFVNSLGAVIGTILGGFYLLHYFGLNGTTYFGASLDLLCGLSCLFIAGKSLEKQKERQNEEEEENQVALALSDRQNRIVFWVAGISGLSAMIYEVVWLRLLIPILSSSTYSFSVILTVFIFGITLGSYIVYRTIERIKDPYRFLAICQFGIVITTLLSIPFYDKLPYYIWSAIGDPASSSYSYYVFIQLLYVVLLIVPPTLFMGMSLPIASRLYVKDVQKAGKTVGTIFAFNTLGTVVGSLSAGLLLIPMIGIKNTLQLAILVNVILAVILFLTGTKGSKLSFGILGGIFLLSSIFYMANVDQDNWAKNIMLSEVSRKINRIEPPESFAEFALKADNHDAIHFYEEGINGTIVVAQHDKEVYLFTNGKGDANSVGDLSTQVSLGLTPVILHPSPDSVFVIGFGAGTTIGHVMTHDRVVYGEVAEISKDVIDASSYFDDINAQPLKNKNLRVIRDDGLTALRVSPRKYDVIISQPSNPWSAGVGNLFTKEFFHSCKNKLRPGGYVAQWFNLYEMDDESMRLIVRTALSEFKYMSMWHLGSSDILLLCSETPINTDLDQIEQNFGRSAVELQRIDIHSYAAFLSQQLISDQQTIESYAGNGPLNTENLPLLEHWAPKAYYYNSSPDDFYQLDERSNIEEHSSHLLYQYLNGEQAPSKDGVLQAGLFQSNGGNKELAFYLADLNPSIYLLWAEKAKQLGNLEKATEYEALATERTIAQDPNKSKAEKAASAAATAGNYQQALKEIAKAIAGDPKNPQLYYQQGTFYLSLGQLQDCINSMQRTIDLDPTMIDAYNNMANAKGQQQKYDEVIQLLNRAEKYSTSNAKVYFNRGYAYALTNKFQLAVDDFTKALNLNPNYGMAYFLRARAQGAINNVNKACQDLQKAMQLNVEGAAELYRQGCQN